jgi:peptidoglycan-associated lipoprotein
MRIWKLALSAFFALAIVNASCSDDQKAAEEVIEPSAGEAVDAPDIDTGSFAPEVLYFAFDDYTLNMDAQNKLTSLGDYIKNNAGVSVQIEGHCDERGTVEYNLALGQRRSESVKSFLVRLGVDPNSLSTISYGEERPKDEGHEEGAWSQNRRAEFIVNR